MNKPQEHEYTSHVAYCRALEEYCEALQAEVESLLSVRDKQENYMAIQGKMIAARDLVIKQMREAMNAAWNDGYCLFGPEGFSEDQEQFSSAMLLQASTEALDAYVAEKVEAEREACANVCKALADCEENTDGYRNGAGWCSEAIRSRTKHEQ